MGKIIQLLTIVLLFSTISVRLLAQDAIVGSGGNGTGGGGTFSFSYGQFAYQTFFESSSSIEQGVQHPFEISENPLGIPETLTVSDTTFLGLDNCLGALQTITIAGDGDSVLVTVGASVNFIAGQSIHLLSGFHAYQGSIVNAYITTDATFCSTEKAITIVSQPLEDISLQEKESIQPLGKWVKVYPNPNNGQFTILLNNFESNVKIYIYNTIGSVFYQSEINNDALHQINLSAIRQGIYFVRINDDKEQFTKKIIVN
jgi:hypothetical protein